MRKISSYLYIFAVLGVIVLVAGLALGGHSVNLVVSKVDSGLCAGVPVNTSGVMAMTDAQGCGESASVNSAAGGSDNGRTTSNPPAAAAAPTAAMAAGPRGDMSLSTLEGPALSGTTGSSSSAPAAAGGGRATSSNPPAVAYSGDGSATSSDAPAPHDSTGMDVAEATAVAPANQMPQTPSSDQNPLRASEVDDNADYNTFSAYLQSNYGVVPGNISPDLSERYFVQVQNGQQRPVADAVVKISSNGQSLFTGRTGSDGRVVFFPHAVQGSDGAQSFDVAVSRD